MEITEKTTGELIDQLITTSLKCWFAQETVMNSMTEREIARAAKLAQSTNAQRNKLIRAINERLGEGDNSPTEKTYG